jgi:hypothetical protein
MVGFSKVRVKKIGFTLYKRECERIVWMSLDKEEHKEQEKNQRG